jgi:predicted ATPase/DNA-binding winged helix-turn-helix (wHTH) protein
MSSRNKMVNFRSKIRQAKVIKPDLSGSDSSFSFDTRNECLRRGDQAITLTPKPFAVLRYLADHPGRLVTKQELLEAVWPQTYVSEAVLKNCVLKLREALGDQARTPHFIETVHGRGYRLIGKVASSQHSEGSREEHQKPVLSVGEEANDKNTGQAKGLRREAAGPPPFFPSSLEPTASSLSQDSGLNTQHSVLVGRNTELAQLHGWLAKTLKGERQVVFVTGEPGIGKTTVVETFLERAAAAGDLWIGRGQCIEHFGTGEAYLPVLDALGRLCRKLGRERLIELLGQLAPTWLVQMPALLNATDLETLQRKVLGATRERMLREMVEAMEALAAEKPFVLQLEDLQWSDYSTLDLLSFVARRQERARLLVIGTCRPVEMLETGHPLRVTKQELQQHRHCEELRLGLLTEAAVGEYLAQRFPAKATRWSSLQRLAQVIHQRTEGNPLFMVNVVDSMASRGATEQIEQEGTLQEEIKAVEVGAPESIQQMIEEQIARLVPEDQRMLEAASVAGAEFSAAAVAAGAETEVSEIEARSTGLARRAHFLRESGTAEWPDGTVASRYGFLHALYQEVLYKRITAARRIELHRRIGEREEAAYGARAEEVAAELAVHFERGRDYRRAVRYLERAAESAARRSAHQEAIDHLTKGLALLSTLPDILTRTQHELTLQIALGVPLIATKGPAAPEVERAYTRARALCQQVGETPQLFPVLRGLCVFYLNRGELRTAHELAKQLLQVAQRVQDSALLLEAHHWLGATLLFRGDFTAAQEHFEQSLALYNAQSHHALAFLSKFDPRVFVLGRMSQALWLLGYPDRALQKSQEALTWAQELAHPLSLAIALTLTAFFHQLRREGSLAQERAEELITLSDEREFVFPLAGGTFLQGWALAEQGQKEEGIAQMRQGQAALQVIGAKLGQSAYLAMLAEAHGQVGQAEKGLKLLAAALTIVQENGERYWEAELYRLAGELLLRRSEWEKGETEELKNERAGERETGRTGENENIAQSPSRLVAPSSPEECFLKAIDIARQQSAKSWELRATMSLARVWQSQGKTREAHKILVEIYDWFTEGFDTADLKEAKALLEKLA